MKSLVPDIHVSPINDMKEHMESRDCWCVPRLIEESGRVVVVHNSMDGRELIEEYGLQ